MERDLAAWIDEARQQQHDGELELAAATYRRILQAQPAQVEALTGLAEIFQARGNAIEAVALLEEGLRSSPDSASLLESLGDARHARGLLASAISAYREALDREPCRTGALWGMGCAQASLGDHAAAAESLRQLVELQPDYGQGHHNRGRSLYELGQVDQALESFQRAFHVLPPEARAVPLTNMAMVIPGSPSVGNREILECRRAWASQCLLSGPVNKTFPDRDSRQDRPLRLGYVSAYFARRNWMKPVWGLINHHDRERFEIHHFSDGPEPSIAEGYGRHSRDHLHETSGLSNEALAELIEAVQIDLLVELNGYCKPPRLGLFALRAAPVQVAWFGMFATSGLSELDYLVGDRHVIPAQEESFYTEQVVRVPGSYLTFEVGYPVPDISPLPCLAAGFLTFGCLAPQYKITTEVIEAWSRILSASPTSRLVLKNVVLEQPAARDFVRSQFARFSIAPIGWTSRARPSIIHSWSDTPASTSPWIRFPTMVERLPWKPSGKASRCSALPATAGPRGSAPPCCARRAWRNSSLRTLNFTSRRPSPWPEILIPPTAFSSCARRCATASDWPRRAMSRRSLATWRMPIARCGSGGASERSRETRDLI